MVTTRHFRFQDLEEGALVQLTRRPGEHPVPPDGVYRFLRITADATILTFETLQGVSIRVFGRQFEYDYALVLGD